MSARHPIGKRQRFEIFKRDGFRCVYCGRTPPDVLLHVDHVVAVVDGGDDDVTNLTTACADCNLGKGARPLSAIAPNLEHQAEEMRERADQVAAYSTMMLEIRRERDAQIDRLHRVFSDGLLWPAKMSGHVLRVSAERKASLRRFLERLTEAEILDAFEITASAAERYPDTIGGQRFFLTENGGVVEGIDARWRYFCGVCWKKVTDRERPSAEDIEKLRNRLKEGGRHDA